MNDVVFLDWLSAFLWTLVLELPVYALCLRERFGGWRTPIVLALGMNAVSHPLLWFVFPKWQPFWLWLLVAESCVTLFEGMILAIALACVRSARPVGTALAVAVAANALSTGFGLAANALHRLWSALPAGVS